MAIPFADYGARIQLHLQHFYAIRIVTRDIPDPLTGDLDGSEIHIDHAVTPDQRLFLLGHLFGHTVQWNTDPGAFETGRQYKPPVNEDLIPAIIAYEGEAACYAVTLFHEAGITDVDEWLSRYTACDQAYLLHYYRAGGTSAHFGAMTSHGYGRKPFHRSLQQNEFFAWMALSFEDGHAYSGL